MRKYLIAAVAAFAALSMAAVAVAQQYPAPEPSMKVSVSPKNAGTKNKPKATGLDLFVANTEESKTTASDIQVDLPKTLRISGKGLKKCSESTLASGGPNDCPDKSIVGEGVAHANLGPYNATPTPLTLDVTAVVGGAKQLFFYVTVGSVNGLLDGKITRNGRRLTLAIPENLKKPDGVTYSALTDLDVELERSAKLIKSTGCKGGKHKIKTKLTYEPNPTPPPVSSATASGNASCSK